jgi:precorrin-6B methylase 2
MFFFISGSVLAQPDPWKNVYTQSAWAARDSWQRADELLQQLNLKKGSVVADIGSHEGYMTFKLSKAVGEGGKVYAIDVEESKLEKLKGHIEKAGVDNIQPMKGAYDNPNLPALSIDAAIIIDTYHEMDDHDKILQHLKTALRKGGRLVVCEPIDEERRKAERSVQEGRHELGINFALDDLRRAGFKIVKQQDPFVDREKIKGDKMWLIVAEKI